MGNNFKSIFFLFFVSAAGIPPTLYSPQLEFCSVSVGSLKLIDFNSPANCNSQNHHRPINMIPCRSSLPLLLQHVLHIIISLLLRTLFFEYNDKSGVTGDHPTWSSIRQQSTPNLTFEWTWTSFTKAFQFPQSRERGGNYGGNTSSDGIKFINCKFATK